MINVTELSEYLKEKLLPIKPSKIILFGSYAYGNPTKDSDIDLLVVTDDKHMPASFSERMDIVLKVSYLIDDLKNKYPVDLLVYTEPMYKLFIELDSLFSNEITQKGIVIYEKNNSAMV